MRDYDFLLYLWVAIWLGLGISLAILGGIWILSWLLDVFINFWTSGE